MRNRYRRIFEDDEYDEPEYDSQPVSDEEGDEEYDYSPMTETFKTFGDLVEGDDLYIVYLEFDEHGNPEPKSKTIEITSITQDSIYCKSKYDSVFIEEETDFDWDDSYSYIDDQSYVADTYYAADEASANYLQAKLLKIDFQQKVRTYKDIISDLLDD